MLGALGCVVPEVFGPAGTPNWVNIQAEIFRPEGLNYLDNPAIIHAKSPVATVAVLVIVMGLAGTCPRARARMTRARMVVLGSDARVPCVRRGVPR